MSLPDVGAAVSRLREQSARLNDLTDQANELVKHVEHFLNGECSVGLPSACVMAHYDDDSGTSLEYRRVQGTFRIAYVTFGTNGEDESVKPWAECPRGEKLASVAYLPALLNVIADNVEASAHDAELAIVQVREVLPPPVASDPAPRRYGPPPKRTAAAADAPADIDSNF